MENPSAGAPAADGSASGGAATRAAPADVAIAAAVLAALALRISGARQKILWFDEFLAGNLVRHRWTALFPAIRVEAHPPLYYALLKLWCGLFGDGAFAMRSLSVAAGVAAVAVVAGAVRRAWGGAAAAAAATLIALSTVQVDQGSEAKPYAVLGLALALLLAAVLRDRRLATPGSLAQAVLAGGAAASVHFYGGAAGGAIAAAAILTAPDRAHRRRGAVLLAAIVAISGAWLAGAAGLARGAADYIRDMWGRVPLWAPLAASTRVALPGWRKPYPAMDGRILPDLAPREIAAAALVGLILLVAAIRAGRGRRAPTAVPAGSSERRFLVLSAIALWPGFLALEIAFAAADRPIAIVGRSEVVVEIGLAILVALAVSRWPRPWLPIAALAAAGLWTVVPQWRPRPGPQGHRWEEVIVQRLLAGLPPGGRADVVTLGLARPPLDYYAAGDPRIRFLSFPEAQNAHPGWAAHSVTAAERDALAGEAVRLIAVLDGDLDRGVPVYVAERPDPRNDPLLSDLRRDHELRPVPWAAPWFLRVTRSPVLSAGPLVREPFSTCGVRKGEGGSTCIEVFVWRSSSSSRPRRSTPPPTAGSRSPSWSPTAHAANIARGTPSTSKRFAAFPTRCA